MTRFSRNLPVLLRERGGAAALEFGLILPALLALMWAIVEVGHLLWTVTALNMAVEDAARCASVSNASTAKTPCGTQAQTQSYASSHSWGLSIPAADFTLTNPTCGYEVAASYPFTPVIKAFPISITLTASACYPQWQ